MKNFEYYAGDDLDFPIRPHKPIIPKNPTAKCLREYTNILEEYEISYARYEDLKKAYYEIINKREKEFREDLKSEYCPEFSDDVFNIIYNKAWEDGHSYGHYRVAELVDDLSCFVIEVMEKMK